MVEAIARQRPSYTTPVSVIYTICIYILCFAALGAYSRDRISQINSVRGTTAYVYNPVHDKMEGTPEATSGEEEKPQEQQFTYISPYILSRYSEDELAFWYVSEFEDANSNNKLAQKEYTDWFEEQVSLGRIDRLYYMFRLDVYNKLKAEGTLPEHAETAEVPPAPETVTPTETEQVPKGNIEEGQGGKIEPVKPAPTQQQQPTQGSDVSIKLPSGVEININDKQSQQSTQPEQAQEQEQEQPSQEPAPAQTPATVDEQAPVVDEEAPRPAENVSSPEVPNNNNEEGALG